MEEERIWERGEMVMMGVSRKSGEMGNCGQDIMMREERSAVCFKILMI